MLIPKESKDLTLRKNFRPILLLNVALQIFTKILAKRFGELLPNMIGLDQIGFIQNREARDNVIRTLNIIQVKKIPLVLLGIDAEKAFDRLSWWYMKVQCGFGIGEKVDQVDKGDIIISSGSGYNKWEFI